MKDERHRLLIFFGAGLLAVLLLSAGLNGMEMHPSSLYTPQGYAELIALFELLTSRATLTAAVVCLTPALLFTLYVMVVVRNRRGVSPKKKNSLLVYLDALLWTLAILVIARTLQRSRTLAGLEGGEGGEAAGPEILPPVEINPDPSTVTAVFVGFILLIGVAVIAWLLWSRTRPQVNTIQRLSQEAEIALQTIQTGGDLRNSILHCYAEMCRILNQQQGIRRQEAMTAREFEGRLLQAGLPEEPVRQLTRLFENVRYGAGQPDTRQEFQAVNCLSAIADASRRPG